VKNSWKKLSLVFVLLAAAIAGPAAAHADSGLLVVDTSAGRLQATKHVDVDFHCTATCSVVVTRHLKVPGPDPVDSVVSGSEPFPANTPARFTITFNNKALKFIRHDRKRVKMRLTFSVTNLDTGVPDTVVRTFGFKK
jgi:hypothetical protein